MLNGHFFSEGETVVYERISQCVRDYLYQLTRRSLTCSKAEVTKLTILIAAEKPSCRPANPTIQTFVYSQHESSPRYSALQFVMDN